MRFRDEISTVVRAAHASRPRPEISGHLRVDAGELRAKAARYRRLVDGLYDPRVIDEVQACARELDAEAAWIEKQDAYAARMVIQRRRIG